MWHYIPDNENVTRFFLSGLSLSPDACKGV